MVNKRQRKKIANLAGGCFLGWLARRQAPLESGSFIESETRLLFSTLIDPNSYKKVSKKSDIGQGENGR